jgi:flavoprotein
LTRIAWGITGAGDKIEEILDIMIEVANHPSARVDVFLSKAGKQVMHWYKIWKRLNESFEKVKVEVDANVPFIAGPLQVGTYDALTRAIDLENVERIKKMDGITIIKSVSEIASHLSSLIGEN